MPATGTSDRPDDEPRRGLPPGGPADRFSNDLVGLDPNDPEAKAFAEHLDRMERSRANYTVEGYLSDMSDFAESANRLGGHYRLMAGIVAAIILLGVAVAAWDALLYLLAALVN
jgi:hypothetical protein